MRFANFSLHLSKVPRLPRKSDARSYEVLHLSREIILASLKISLLRKSAPGPPNISDENPSCNAPVTRNPFLQILFKCPTLAIVLGHATKPSRFAHFWQGAEPLAPATQNDASTSKSGGNMWCFVYSDFEMHLNFQKCSERGVLCTLTTSQLPKALRTRQFLNTFDFQMCFAPQRRALFRRHNFQKCSEHDMFCTF